MRRRLAHLLLLLLCALATTAAVAQTTDAPATTPKAKGAAKGKGKAKGAQAAAAAVPEGTKVLTNLPYVTNGHASQALDLYVPMNKTAGVATPPPLIVFIHGGGWQAGSKQMCPARAFLAKGYAVASVEYRFSDVAIFPAQVEDCKAALRWLRAHAGEHGYNADKIAVWGPSAGGHLVSMLGVTGHLRDFDVGENLDQSSQVQAVIDCYGPIDFEHYGDGPNPGIRDDRRGTVTKLLGGAIKDKLDLARRASPITHVQKDAAPFLILQGDADPLVPVQQSRLIDEKLKSLGVESTLKILPGAGHGGPQFQSAETVGWIEAFLNKHLKAGA